MNFLDILALSYREEDEAADSSRPHLHKSARSSAAAAAGAGAGFGFHPSPSSPLPTVRTTNPARMSSYNESSGTATPTRPMSAAGHSSPRSSRSSSHAGGAAGMGFTFTSPSAPSDARQRLSSYTSSGTGTPREEHSWSGRGERPGTTAGPSPSSRYHPATQHPAERHDHHHHNYQQQQHAATTLLSGIPLDHGFTYVRTPTINKACSAMGCNHIAVGSCKKCGIAHYCSSQCQLVDWPRHKPLCKVKRADKEERDRRAAAEEERLRRGAVADAALAFTSAGAAATMLAGPGGGGRPKSSTGRRPSTSAGGIARASDRPDKHGSTSSLTGMGRGDHSGGAGGGVGDSAMAAAAAAGASSARGGLGGGLSMHSSSSSIVQRPPVSAEMQAIAAAVDKMKVGELPKNSAFSGLVMQQTIKPIMDMALNGPPAELLTGGPPKRAGGFSAGGMFYIKPQFSEILVDPKFAKPLNVVQELTDERDALPQAKAPTWITGFHRAILHGQDGLVKAVLSEAPAKKAMPPDVRDDADFQPLFYAARKSMEVVKVLIARGANVNRASVWSLGAGKYPVTALYSAVQAGRLDIVKYLLAHGANPSTYDPVGNPLVSAALEAGGKLTHQPRAALMPVVGDEPSKDPNDYWDIAAELVKAGADLTAGQPSSLHVMHVAAAYAPLHLLQIMAQFCGAAPLGIPAMESRQIVLHFGTMIERESTPMHCAVARGDPEALHYLCKMGGARYLDRADIDGDTPLHLALGLSRFELGPILLAHGANPYLVNSRGKIPITLLTAYMRKRKIKSTNDLMNRDKYTNLSRAARLAIITMMKSFNLLKGGDRVNEDALNELERMAEVDQKKAAARAADEAKKKLLAMGGAGAAPEEEEEAKGGGSAKLESFGRW